MIETRSSMADFATAAQSADRIERHVAAGESSRARDLLNRILPSVGRDVDVFQTPDQVSFDAGFTFVCIKLNRPERALHFARLGLLRDAQDVVLHALLSEPQKIYFAREFIHFGRAAAARAILALVLETAHSDPVAQMIGVLDYFETEQARILALPPRQAQSRGRRPLLMNVVIWGADYVRDFFNYGLPSLMAAGNIPHCARDRTVILDIYTSAADRDAIEKGLSAARDITVRFNIIPDHVLYPKSEETFDNADRWCSGGAQLCSALRAWRLGADLSFINPSGLYSADCFAAASAFIDDGYAVVMACSPRAREPVPHGALRRYATITETRIDIAAASLTAFIVENLHAHCRDLFLSDPPRTARQDPTTLYFKTPTGFVSRTFQPSPLLISHDVLRGDFRFDYMTTDARFVAELLRDRDLDGVIKIARNPGDGLVIVDVDGGTGTGMRDDGEIPVTLEISATCFLGTAYRESDLRIYEWLLAQRFTVAADGGPLPDGGVDEQVAIDRLLEIVHRDSGPVTEKIRIFEKFARLEA